MDDPFRESCVERVRKLNPELEDLFGLDTDEPASFAPNALTGR
jgi:hypothetical protein